MKGHASINHISFYFLSPNLTPIFLSPFPTCCKSYNFVQSLEGMKVSLSYICTQEVSEYTVVLKTLDKC